LRFFCGGGFDLSLALISKAKESLFTSMTELRRITLLNGSLDGIRKYREKKVSLKNRIYEQNS